MSIQTEINRLNDAKATLTNWMDSQNVNYEEGANLTAIADTISRLKVYDEVVLAEGTIVGGLPIQIDMSPYRRLYITFIAYNGTDINTGGSNNTLVMDLTTTNSRMNTYAAGMSVPYVYDGNGGYGGIMWCHCRVSADKQTFTTFVGYNDTTYNDSDMYCVTKIVGVK